MKSPKHAVSTAGAAVLTLALSWSCIPIGESRCFESEEVDPPLVIDVLADGQPLSAFSGVMDFGEGQIPIPVQCPEGPSVAYRCGPGTLTVVILPPSVFRFSLHTPATHTSTIVVSRQTTACGHRIDPVRVDVGDAGA